VHGFPAALSSFVGRAAELEKVASLLEDYRLVTVTGPGGVGKTRLASEVARRVAGEFADGACLAELAGVQDPTLVPAAVAAAVGVPQSPDLQVVESLRAALSRRQLLLVLDNCEHVIGAVAELCGGLLPLLDDMRVLATSREPIGLAGEVRYRLGPLPLPDTGVSDGAAVTLFADRARQADTEFELTAESGPLAARIVIRLDGMPLAIELAAARVEALGLPGLLDRLDHRFRLLTSNDRTASVRQQSLAATVDWSYQLLDQDIQRVFRQLALVPAPFTLDAAEQVAGAGAEPAVLHLVNCSLLTPPRNGPDGRARYMMLETLRAFGLERLTEAGEYPDAAAALAEYALRVAEEASSGLQTSDGEPAAARWLDAETAIVHQALAWALEHNYAIAVRLAVALAPWWGLRGRFEDAYRNLAAAAPLAAPGREQWCMVQIRLGDAAWGAHGPEKALGYYTAARDAATSTEPSATLVDAMAGRANCLMNLDRIADGTEETRRALALSRELAYLSGEVTSLTDLGIAAHYRGDHEESLRWVAEACAVDPARIPGKLARECIAILANTQRLAGQADAARRSCMDALSRAAEAGDLQNQTISHVIMAWLDLEAERLDEAAKDLHEGLELDLRTGGNFSLGDCLDICGHLCAVRGKWEDAVTVWAALVAARQAEGRIDLPKDVERRHGRLLKASHVLGPARTRRAEERGSAMTPRIAAEFALVLAAPGARDDALEPGPGLAQLSARERELVTLVAQGCTDAQIAGQLYISISTVRSHLDRIRDKTSCRRRADLTRLGLRAGLV
jgi:predicted ATPase/DNA-binding CsgD family transcriptional regulator